MKNSERYKLIDDLTKQASEIKDKLYEIVWEAQEPDRENHFDSLLKSEQVALTGLLVDASNLTQALTLYISWFKKR